MIDAMNRDGILQSGMVLVSAANSAYLIHDTHQNVEFLRLSVSHSSAFCGYIKI